MIEITIKSDIEEIPSATIEIPASPDEFDECTFDELTDKMHDLDDLAAILELLFQDMRGYTLDWIETLRRSGYTISKLKAILEPEDEESLIEKTCYEATMENNQMKYRRVYGEETDEDI